MGDRALLVGINEYSSASRLRGCVNDVGIIEKLLSEVFGIHEIVKLTNEQATRRAILDELDWLAESAESGDRRIFHFSGHGSFIVDLDGDEQDNRDEILCCVDMDFDDPDTYIVDDEIGKWADRLAPGVSTSLIIDACHSGTALRMVREVFATDILADAIDPDALVEFGQRPVVMTPEVTPSRQSSGHLPLVDTPIARFLMPPAQVQRRVVGARQEASPLKRSDSTAVLFAGCDDAETAADAPIAGTYYGAFSYNFCEVVRSLGKEASIHEVIQNVRSQVKDYGQTPQLYPSSSAGTIFESGGNSTPAPSEGVDTWGNEMRTLIGEMARLVDRMPGSRAVGSKPQLVYVHGICRHREGYSDAWWQALKPHTRRFGAGDLNGERHEVLWSDLVNQRSTTHSAEADELTIQIQDTLQDRVILEATREAGQGTESTSYRDLRRRSLSLPGFNCIDDFSRYLLSKRVRRQVQQRFFDVVEPVLGKGPVHIISHSWGSVVAYECLRQLSEVYPDQSNVSTFFAVGSALSIKTVERHLEARDGQKPTLVEQWINLDSKGDPVGGSLRDRGFAIDQEYLNLQPVGCRSLFGLFSPSCAHSSYFDKANLIVNRDIFARHIG